MNEKDKIIVDVNKFLTKCSFNGLYALYILHLALIHKKAFSLDNIEKKIPDFPKLNIHSFMVAMNAIGIVEYTYNEDGNIINVISFNEYLSSKIQFAILDRAQKHDSKIMNLKDFEILSWVNEIKMIETYF